jgi:hypothetical protein
VRTAEVTEGGYHAQFDGSNDNHATVADAGRSLGYFWSRRGSNCLERDLVRSNFYCYLVSRTLRRLNSASAPCCPAEHKRCTSLHYFGHMTNHKVRPLVLSRVRRAGESRPALSASSLGSKVVMFPLSAW